MGDSPGSRVSRVRAGATHKSTLVTKWRVKVTGIEFVNDVYMSENGYNLSDRAPDAISYPQIKENFHGWGRGPHLTGWDWQGSDNLERAACYIRLKPVVLKVRLRCDIPAPSARTFVLVVTPTLNGDATLLSVGSKSVKWEKGSREQVLEIATGGALPDEVARFELQLIWSLQDLAIVTDDGSTTSDSIVGVIARSRHTIFSIYGLPKEPTDNSEAGKDYYFDTGLTKQRLDKLTHIVGGSKRRFQTASGSKLDELVWRVVQNVNNSPNPPYFYGDRSFKIHYNLKPARGAKNKKPESIEIGVVDQWVMWAPSGGGYNGPFPHWNFGACITYIQLMKTMLAAVGVHARLSWVFPRTTQLPDVNDPVLIRESEVVDFDSHDRFLPTQKHEFVSKSKTEIIKSEAEVVLIERPTLSGWESFEGCLCFNKHFYPGAIPTSLYPLEIQNTNKGFNSGVDVLKWWITVKHQDPVTHKYYDRFMVWKYQKTPTTTPLFYDRDGIVYQNPYAIPHIDWLPIDQ
jgi:hypothetical protein